jgi:hypothetical protein
MTSLKAVGANALLVAANPEMYTFGRLANTQPASKDVSAFALSASFGY